MENREILERELKVKWCISYTITLFSVSSYNSPSNWKGGWKKQENRGESRVGYKNSKCRKLSETMTCVTCLSKKSSKDKGWRGCKGGRLHLLVRLRQSRTPTCWDETSLSLRLHLAWKGEMKWESRTPTCWDGFYLDARSVRQHLLSHSRDGKVTFMNF